VQSLYGTSEDEGFFCDIFPCCPEEPVPSKQAMELTREWFNLENFEVPYMACFDTQDFEVGDGLTALAEVLRPIRSTIKDLDLSNVLLSHCNGGSGGNGHQV